MAEVTVTQFAEVLKVPVDRLLTQLGEAGIKVGGADDIISEEAKMELLTHLRRAHGRHGEDAAAPRKITLQRKSQQEIKLASTQGRARTVAVEVRRKKTYLNRSVIEEEQRQRQEEVDKRAHGRGDARAWNRSARKTTAVPPSSASATASRRTSGACEEEAARVRAEADARVAAEQQARERTERERADAERRAAEPPRPSKPVRAPESAPSRAPAPGAPTKYGRQELHVSANAKASFKKKQQPAGRYRRSGQVQVEARHGFVEPTAPVKRDVQIPETITVGELANRMAIKANEVIKTMMKMGVMATINQPIDQDTATARRRGIRPHGDRAEGRPARGAVARDVGRHRSAAASAGRDHHGSRRPRQDVAARLHPHHQGGGGRGGRHHAAHRRLPGADAEGPDHVHRHPGTRGIHRDARPRRERHRHRHPRGGGGRRRHAADDRSDPARPRGGSADRRRRQQDRQARRGSRPRAQRPRQAERHPRGMGRRRDVRQRLGAHRRGHRQAARIHPAAGRSARSQGADHRPRRGRRARVQHREGPRPGRDRAGEARHAQDRRPDHRGPGIRPRACVVRRAGQAGADGRPGPARAGARPVGCAGRRRRPAGRRERAQGA